MSKKITASIALAAFFIDRRFIYRKIIFTRANKSKYSVCLREKLNMSMLLDKILTLRAILERETQNFRRLKEQMTKSIYMDLVKSTYV